MVKNLLRPLRSGTLALATLLSGVASAAGADPTKHVSEATLVLPDLASVQFMGMTGKSLLMVFAAQKLRMHAGLKNPTVLIVVDRIDLDSQITGTFTGADIPNLEKADSRDKLQQLLAQDVRKIIITTIFKFGEATGSLNDRSNIIALVDEAHRTQEGDLGRKMREALPNAFLFGLTGTPINRADRNTFYAFGADEDEKGYMSRYGFEESIRDGATLKLHFEPRLIDLHIDKAALDAAYKDLTGGLSDLDKDNLAKTAAKMAVLVKTPERIRKICEDIVDHFQTKVEPNDIEDLLMGCAFPEGEQGFNVAKLVGMIANLPQSVAGATINRFCGSSMQGIHVAAGSIAMGAGDVFIRVHAELLHIVVLVAHLLIFEEHAVLALGHTNGVEQVRVGGDVDRLHVGEGAQHHLHFGRAEHLRVMLHVAVVHLDIRLREEAENLRQQVLLGGFKILFPVAHVIGEGDFLRQPVNALLHQPRVIRPGVRKGFVDGFGIKQ